MYAVYQGYTPATNEHFEVEEKFNNNIFETFEEAEDYLISFLGKDAIPKGKLKLNEPFDIGGEVVEIRTHLLY